METETTWEWEIKKRSKIKRKEKNKTLIYSSFYTRGCHNTLIKGEGVTVKFQE